MLKILKGEFINKRGIECLKNYKYKGSDYTILDKALQPWWNYFVELIPLVSVTILIPIDGCSKCVDTYGSCFIVICLSS